MTPDATVGSVADISLPMLRAWNVNAILLDLDNTIVPWHTAQVVPAARAWVAELSAAGIRFCLLTNNYGRQAKEAADLLDIPLVRAAVKPLPGGYRRALTILDTPATSALVIGDQLFTDVLGAKLLGIRAAIVSPIGPREFLTAKIMRWFERPILRRLSHGDGHG